MAKRLKVTRKELLKEPDQFLSTSQKVSLYVSHHKNNLLIGIGVIVVLVGLVKGYQYNQQVQNLRMESLYFKMVKIHDQKPGKDSKGSTAELEKLLGQFSAGPQQVRASLLVAEDYFRTEQFDKAIALYTDILQKSELKDLSNQLAKVGLAYSYEGKKDYAKAIETYKALVSKPDGFPLFDVYIGLARCYELNKDQKNALLTLREIETKFQGHPQLESVERQIAMLSGKA
jgi:predicted negative regulator of RcsB-dependent stress response